MCVRGTTSTEGLILKGTTIGYYEGEKQCWQFHPLAAVCLAGVFVCALAVWIAHFAYEHIAERPLTSPFARLFRGRDYVRIN